MRWPFQCCSEADTAVSIERRPFLIIRNRLLEIAFWRSSLSDHLLKIVYSRWQIRTSSYDRRLICHFDHDSRWKFMLVDSVN